MKRPAPLDLATALCASLPVADAADGAAPEWVHLLPAGEIRTVDGRGPYLVKSLQAMADAFVVGDKLPIDECHSTDRAAPLGQPAPARGWIVALQARDDGLWGRVEWTGEGERLMRDKAYRGLSPAILHTKAGEVLRVLRASLINTPNLQGLVALHSTDMNNTQETSMDWKMKLIGMLGLDDSADDAAVMAALEAKMKATEMSLNSADILNSPQFVALQSTVTELTGQLNATRDAQARKDAEAFVDGAIAEGRVAVKAVRDDYIALHMANPAQAIKLVGAMPALKGSLVNGPAPEADPSGFTDADRQVMSLMGLDEETFRTGLAGAGLKKEAL